MSSSRLSTTAPFARTASAPEVSLQARAGLSAGSGSASSLPSDAARTIQPLEARGLRHRKVFTLEIELQDPEGLAQQLGQGLAIRHLRLVEGGASRLFNFEDEFRRPGVAIGLSCRDATRLCASMPFCEFDLEEASFKASATSSLPATPALAERDRAERDSVWVVCRLLRGKPGAVDNGTPTARSSPRASFDPTKWAEQRKSRAEAVRNRPSAFGCTTPAPPGLKVSPAMGEPVPNSRRRRRSSTGWENSASELKQAGPLILDVDVRCCPAALCRDALAASSGGSASSTSSLSPCSTKLFWRVTPEEVQGKSNRRRSRTASGWAGLEAEVQPLGVDVAVPSGPEDGLLQSTGPLADVLAMLQPHQRRSLQWMRMREAHPELLVCEQMGSAPVRSWELANGAQTLASQRRLLDSNCQLFSSWKTSKAFEIAGGVLCDPVGSGKTLVCLTLCAAGPPPRIGVAVGSDRLPLEATLVLCPENVHSQWVSEVRKWELSGLLAVLPLRTVADLRAAPLRDAGIRDGRHRVVIAPYSLLLATAGAAEFLSPQAADAAAWSKIMQAQQSKTRWAGMALDCYRWSRVVLDEFHELAQGRGRLHLAVSALRSDARFGLTGTPEAMLQNSMRSAARLFGAECETQESALRFVRTFFRTNAVELDIEVRHVDHIVELAPTERSLYVQRARDLGLLNYAPLVDATQPLGEGEIQRLGALVRMCSHFRPGGIAVTRHEQDSAAAAAEELLAEKRKGVAAAWAKAGEHGMVYNEAQLMAAEDRDAAAGGPAKPPPFPEVTIVVAGASHTALARNAEGAPGVTRMRSAAAVVSIRRPGTPEAVARRRPEAVTGVTRQVSVRDRARDWPPTKHATTSAPSTDTAERTRLRLAHCRERLAASHGRVADAERSANFLSQVWRLMTSSEADREQQCPICIDDYEVRSKGALFPCGHLFCEECSRGLAESASSSLTGACGLRCPVCRTQHAPKDIALVRNLRLWKDCEEDDVLSPRRQSVLAARRAEFGCKISAVVETLLDIRRLGEKAILFCQWADLEDRVAEALEATGVEVSQLSRCNDVFQRTQCIEAFQDGGSQGPQVMLLSYEHSASGTHLTAASHVLVLHPMAAATVEISRAYERQAVGRVARLGQGRPVSVHRFVAGDTVEAALVARIARAAG